MHAGARRYARTCARGSTAGERVVAAVRPVPACVSTAAPHPASGARPSPYLRGYRPVQAAGGSADRRGAAPRGEPGGLVLVRLRGPGVDELEQPPCRVRAVRGDVPGEPGERRPDHLGERRVVPGDDGEL